MLRAPVGECSTKSSFVILGLRIGLIILLKSLYAVSEIKYDITLKDYENNLPTKSPLYILIYTRPHAALYLQWGQVAT